VATHRVIGEESAKAIVWETTILGGVVGGNEPGE